ncbi:hypothetical protein [Paenibacillus lutrae]|nr:hypothetical protein [Paenibacillus lutrae]
MVQIAISEDGKSFAEEVIDCGNADFVVESVDPAFTNMEIKAQLAFEL